MPLPYIDITRTAGNLGRQGLPANGVAALVCGGVSVTGGAQVGTIYKLLSVKAAEDLGLDADYDTANTVLVHYHVSEFFRMNASGELHLLMVAQGTTMQDMVDKDNSYLKAVLTNGQGTIRAAGVVLNPGSGYSSTLSGGLDADSINAIATAQALADDEYGNDRPVDNIVIEGREFNGTVAAATDLRNIAGGPFRDVSVCIAQDKDASGGHADFAKTAAVGAYLGAITNKTASQSFARPVSQFNLFDAASGRMQSAQISSGVQLSSLSLAEQDSLNDKGYVFTRTFNGYDGVYFNQSSVCAPLTDDYAFSELRAVINQSVRIARPILIPYVNSTDFPVVNGRIDAPSARRIEAELESALSVMANEVSSFGTLKVDPATDGNGDPYPSFLVDNRLRAVIGIVPKGKATEILVTIGYQTG